MAKAPDLLAGLKEEEAPASLDLLSQIADSDGEAWVPWNNEDQPTGLQGTVLSISSVASDYNDKSDKPLILIEDADGKQWSIRGYGQVMEGQINNALSRGMQVGDLFAIKYLGEQRNRANTFTYHNVKATHLAQNR